MDLWEEAEVPDRNPNMNIKNIEVIITDSDSFDSSRVFYDSITIWLCCSSSMLHFQA